jgi:hypothetical protein
MQCSGGTRSCNVCCDEQVSRLRFAALGTTEKFTSDMLYLAVGGGRFVADQGP